MSHSERQISSSTASHRCGFRALKSSRTAEKRLQLTAFTTYRDRDGSIRGAEELLPALLSPTFHAAHLPHPSSTERRCWSLTMTVEGRSKMARHCCARFRALRWKQGDRRQGSNTTGEEKSRSEDLWGTGSPSLSQQKAWLPRRLSVNGANFPSQRGRFLLHLPP